tara:strand:+ start:175 stop:672 length:498 start_codon:yes stop_codon:yes gene_type:complete
MWTILKVEKNCLYTLKRELNKKLGNDHVIYSPKLIVQTYKNNKIINKKINLLGDYIFCFHKSFEKNNTVVQLKFLKGLKYFLGGFINAQSEIEKFIEKCKELENEDGFIAENIFNIDKNSDYKFVSGPFTGKLFQIINIQQNKIKILMGDLKTTIKRNKFLFNPA